METGNLGVTMHKPVVKVRDGKLLIRGLPLALLQPPVDAEMQIGKWSLADVPVTGCAKSLPVAVFTFAPLLSVKTI